MRGRYEYGRDEQVCTIDISVRNISPTYVANNAMKMQNALGDVQNMHDYKSSAEGDCPMNEAFRL